MDYVGEWHTHPESGPAPSSLDFCEWRKICKRRKEMMLFLIQGTEAVWMGVGMGNPLKGRGYASDLPAIVPVSVMSDASSR